MAETYDINALRAKYLGTGQAGGSPSAPQGGGYDVEALRQKYLGSTVPPAPALTLEQQKDQESADKYGASFASETGEGLGTSLAKMVGNVPSSAWNFAKGALEIVNPVNTVKNIRDIVQGVPEIYQNSKYTGGAFNTTTELGADVAKSAYEGIVPEAARNVLTGDLQGAGRTLTNDPVGQVLPFVFGAKGAAKIADRTLPNTVSKANMKDYVDNIKENTQNGVPIPTKGTKYSEMVDNAISTVTDPVVSATKTVFGKTGEAVGNTVRYGVSQATGLSPDTITQIGKTPEVFTKEGMSQIDRPSLGRAIKSEFDKRIADLEETGKAYGPVRESGKEIAVDRDFIENVMQDIAGVKVVKGKVQTSGSASVRDSRDVRALQHVYDLWKPSFKKGKLTAEEFLNFRSDLAKLAKFERDVGKSADIEGATARMRARLNEAYRPQLPGLDMLDEQFGPMKSELKTLGKGLIDKDGNLTDAAINKIANATGKGKDPLLARLEEVLPGVTERIKILKAVEDIENATGQKVGAYFRPVPIVGGFAVGGPIGAAISAILLSPGNAVSIIRRYGLMKNSEAIKTIMHTLSTGAQNAKDALQNKPGAFNPRIKLPEGPVGGLSVQNIWQGRTKDYMKGGVPIVRIPNEKLSTPELKQKLFIMTKGGRSTNIPEYDSMVKEIQDRGTFRIEKSTPKKEEKDPDNNTYIDEDGTKLLSDPAEGMTFYHGAPKQNIDSILKNGINTKLNMKGPAEQAEAFYVGDKSEAGWYGKDMVGIRVKPGEKVKTLSVTSQEWADVRGKSRSTEESAAAIRELRKRGYDAVNYGDEIEILNTSKFEAFDPTGKIKKESAEPAKKVGAFSKTEVTPEKLFTTPKATKAYGLKLLEESFGDKESAIFHAEQYWAKKGKPGVFHHVTKEESPFGVFEKDKAANFDVGLRSGISNVNGLYVGRDVKALHEFYNLAAERGDNVVTYKGEPKLLDLTEEGAMKEFTNKFKTGDEIEREISRKGYDGVKYFDPYATGEEIVITNPKALEIVAFNGKAITKPKTGAFSPR